MSDSNNVATMYVVHFWNACVSCSARVLAPCVCMSGMDPVSCGLFDSRNESKRLASDGCWYTREDFMKQYGIHPGFDWVFWWTDKELRVASDGMAYDREWFRVWYGWSGFSGPWEEARIRTLHLQADALCPCISEDEHEWASSVSGEFEAEVTSGRFSWPYGRDNAEVRSFLVSGAWPGLRSISSWPNSHRPPGIWRL